MEEPEIFFLGEREPRRKPKIKVIGVGGAGCNTLVDSPYENIAICGALEDTREIKLKERVLVSSDDIEFMKDTPFRTVRSIKFGLKNRIEAAVGKPDLTFVFAGLGGETGSHIAPLVADVCKRNAGLSISSVALPFSVEGRDRRCAADCSLTNMCMASDITITYHNDHLLEMVPNLPLRRAFNVMNRIMMVPLQELVKVLVLGDLEPVRKSFTYSHCCRLGLGTGSGEYGELRALDEALSSPWFDFKKERVMSVLATITSADVEERAVENVLKELSKKMPYSRISYGCVCDPSMEKKYKVMLILGYS